MDRPGLVNIKHVRARGSQHQFQVPRGLFPHVKAACVFYNGRSHYEQMDFDGDQRSLVLELGSTSTYTSSTSTGSANSNSINRRVCVHYNLKPGALKSGWLVAQLQRKNKSTAKFERVVKSGGVATLGCEIYSANHSLRIGTMLAGNSGLPGGACGNLDGTLNRLHAEYKVQEECVLSDWLMTEAFNEGLVGKHALDYAAGIFKSTIHGSWGLTQISGTSTNTIQNVDYTIAKPSEYGDAWVVSGCLSSKIVVPGKQPWYDHNKQYPTDLVFVSGPNVGFRGKRSQSTTRRTFNSTMVGNYSLFREAVKAAQRAGLHAMAERGCNVAILAGVSTGIYGGVWSQTLSLEYETIINQLLDEKVHQPDGTTVTLGCYFDRVILVTLK